MFSPWAGAFLIHKKGRKKLINQGAHESVLCWTNSELVNVIYYFSKRTGVKSFIYLWVTVYSNWKYFSFIEEWMLSWFVRLCNKHKPQRHKVMKEWLLVYVKSKINGKLPGKRFSLLTLIWEYFNNKSFQKLFSVSKNSGISMLAYNIYFCV